MKKILFLLALTLTLFQSFNSHAQMANAANQVTQIGLLQQIATGQTTPATGASTYAMQLAAFKRQDSAYKRITGVAGNLATDTAIGRLQSELATVINKVNVISAKVTGLITGDSSIVITTNTTTTILSGAAVTITGIDIGTASATNTLTFYNNSAASGYQPIAPILCTLQLYHPCGPRGRAFPNGCTIVSATGSAGKYTVYYRIGVN